MALLCKYLCYLVLVEVQMSCQYVILLVGVYFSSCLWQSEIQLRKEVETRQQLEQMLREHRELIDALTAEILLLREENSTMQVFTCSPAGSVSDSEHVHACRVPLELRMAQLL